MSISPEYFSEIEDIYNVIEKQKCTTVSFTSSQGKEGVTEVILVTARRFAKMNKKVLIVDMNSFQPRLSQDKNVTWRVADFASQAQSFSFLSENIDLLPFPISSHEPDVAFRDEPKFRSMLEYLAGLYDVVLFDTCPLIRVNAANISAQFIASCCDGNFIIVGDTRSSDFDVALNNGAADLWMIKISTDGTLIWEKTIGGTNFDVARSISKTQDNGFVIAGSSRSADNGFVNQGQNDALILKINTEGILEWQKTVGGSEIDFLYDAIQLNNKTIIAVGESSSSNGNITTNQGFSDALIIKIK